MTLGGGERSLAAVSDANGQENAEIGYDKVIENLQAVVGRLESGNLTLEETLAAFEEGVALARRAHKLLDSADERVELLLRDKEGRLTTAPLDDASE